jgi:hypothetical protein
MAVTLKYEKYLDPCRNLAPPLSYTLDAILISSCTLFTVMSYVLDKKGLIQ